MALRSQIDSIASALKFLSRCIIKQSSAQPIFISSKKHFYHSLLAETLAKKRAIVKNEKDSHLCEIFMKYLALTLALITSIPSYADTGEVNLYSARKEALIKPLLDSFTEETGIQVNVISSKADALLKRIQSEGINSPADVLLTTDAGRLHRAKKAGIFDAIDSPLLQSNIPAHYRDSESSWFGLSVRLRPIMLTERADRSIIKNYEDLSNPALKKQICVRSSNNIYNQSLTSSMINANGIEATESWAKGLVANFARKPQGGDRDQIRAAAIGQCSVIIANTYYLAQMLAEQENSKDRIAAEKISVLWPNQDGRGAHANISGAGVIKSAPNKSNAIKLIEFLSSDKAQEIYANVNYEYPVKDGIEINPILAGWGSFKTDTLQLEKLGELNPDSIKLMDRSGWK